MKLNFLLFYFVLVTFSIQAKIFKGSVPILAFCCSVVKTGGSLHDSTPIHAGRTISFHTTESSYLDVDISPDGSTILFSCLGELFSLPAKGGIAKQFTHGLAIKRCPLWSPDGKLIAYESDATGFIKLHVTHLSGGLQKVLGEGSYRESLEAIWFPDSKHVGIYDKVYHLTGTTSALPTGIRYILGFSSDQRFLYSQENISSDSSVISKYDRVNHNKTTLQILYGRHYNNISISPDGNWLTYMKYEKLANGSYTQADSLMAIDLKTGKEKLLAHLNIKFTTAYLKKQHYSFSKDSKYIFIGYGGKIHRIEITTNKNDIIPFTANVQVEMGQLNYNTFNVSLDSFLVRYIRSAQKSPDGKHLIFSALNKIYIQDLPKGKLHVLVDQPFNQFQPVYSPDGKWIAYVSWSDKVGGHLWQIPSGGGTPEQITTHPGLYLHPSWSPDGKKLTVLKGKNKLGRRDYPGDGQLQIISLNDKTVKIIADDVSLFNSPMFSQTGQQIFFKPNQQMGDNKLWPRLISKEVEGKAETVLAYARNAAEVLLPTIRQTLLSPDGRYFVFVYNQDLYLAPMANVGGTQTIFDIASPIQLIRFATGGIDPNWGEGGNVLNWVSGNQYCSINPGKITQAAEQLSPNKTLIGLPETKIIDVRIPPDHITKIRLKAPRHYSRDILVLKNVRIVTMNGNKVIENGSVVIKNGRFISVGKGVNENMPKETKFIDLKGKTLIPGIIDMHSHMYEAVPVDVFLQQSWQRLLHLSYGVTTIRDPSGSFDTFGYSELVETGQAIGPRLFTVGHAVRPNYNLNSLNETKVVVNNRVKMGATVIKQYTQRTRLQRQLLLQACKEAGVNMTNEVEKDPLHCIGMIKDGSTGVEHNPEWGDIYSDVVKLIVKSGTYLCPTLQVCYGRVLGKHYFHKLYIQDFINRSSQFIEDNYQKSLLKDAQEDKLDSSFLDQSRIDARIKHAGGKIVMGSHGEDQGIGAHWEIWALQMGGLTNMEALQTATITAAEGLGMRKDLGSIEVGKIADLLILDKNPLDDIHNTTSIKYVMKAGVLYESNSLDEVWPEKKKCPEWRMKNDAE